MKKKSRRFFFLFLMMVFCSGWIVVLDLKKTERVVYVPLPMKTQQMAATIPPFGIFIHAKYREEGDGRGSILAHERVHWEQYKRMGLIKFYYEYLTEYFRNGRIHHSMEEEARRKSM